MRTLLVCTAVALTGGTFVAAERLMSSTEQSLAAERQTAIDQRIERANAKFAADMAALEAERNAAVANVALLNTSAREVASERNELAKQLEAAETEAALIQEKLDQLESRNRTLVETIEAKQTSLDESQAEVEELNDRIATLSEAADNPVEQGPESAELAAEVASLKALLATREETISALQERIETSGAVIADADGAESQDADASLMEELASAYTRIDELNAAASEQAQASQVSLTELNDALRARDETIAQLRTGFEASAPVSDTTLVSALGPGETGALSERLTELTELVETQAKTISTLRMGFEEAPSSSEMASTCIERANRIFEISQIKFATATSTISEQSITTLDHLRDLAIGCESEEMFIEIGGHTDSLGANASNQRLSEERANSVRDFLIARGIPEDTMVAVGYGETQPVATNDTPLGRAQNRRITFTWQMREDATPDETDG